MEHKLILGGAQYLPFARSRIKALRAAGLRYATQRFLFPDGEVRVQIVAEQEYITLSGGGSCVLRMDSGLVRLFNIASANPDRFLAGVRYDAGRAIAYNAPFLPVDGEDYLAHEDATGQLSGVVAYTSRFAGKLYEDAKSFAPVAVEGVPSSEDETLAAKKTLAVLCPPSIFTGRCRLYVQAIYGRHLYEYSGAGALKATDTLPTLVNDTSAAPALLIAPRTRTVSGTTYADLLLDTSCGVHLDTQTGRHWLFKPSTDGSIYAYPLISSDCGERLRSQLVPSDDGLDADDRANLEAYILAYCKPSVDRGVLIGDLADAGTFSMGYGWHWNITGLVADLVKNETYEQDFTNSAMRSTHYRMTVTRNVDEETGAVTWSAAVAVIEGPSNWSVARGSWCIAGPDYADMVLIKTTPRNSTRFVCDAPFYAFYKGDEVQVCRATVTFKSPGLPTREMSTRFAGSIAYQANDITYTTLGELDGYLEESPNSGTSFKATFTCGDQTTGELYEGYTRTGRRYEVDNKVLLGFTLLTTDVFFTSETLEYGYPDILGAWSTVTYVRNQSAYYSGQYSYDLTDTLFSEVHSGLAIIVVPFYDSEAVYMRHNVGYTRTDTGDVDHMDASIAGGDWQTKTIVNVYDPPLSSHDEDVRKFNWNDAGTGGTGHTVSSTAPVNTTQDVTTTTVEQCLGKAGAVIATFTNVSDFHNNALDSVEANFGTRSGTSSATPVVVAPNYIASIGIDDAPTDAIALVGWI